LFGLLESGIDKLMEFKFLADQSSRAFSILNLSVNPKDKLAQGIAAYLRHPGLAAKFADKQKAWLEAHRWQVIMTRLIYMMALSPRSVAADG
jgi:hypothetical protein